MINPENVNILRLKDWRYADKITSEIDSETKYIEISLKRDRSSFAGISYKLTRGKTLIFAEDTMEEYIIEKINKYDNYNVGLDVDYKDAITKEYEKNGNNIGIEIIFLVYSDVKSSPQIFEQSMQTLLESIKK